MFSAELTLTIFNNHTTLTQSVHCQREWKTWRDSLCCCYFRTCWKYTGCTMSYTSFPPNESILGLVNRGKKMQFVGKLEERSKRKIKRAHVWLSVHHLLWKKKRFIWKKANLMLCNFLVSMHMQGEKKKWRRGSHPSWAMVAECHSPSQIVVYNRGNSSGHTSRNLRSHYHAAPGRMTQTEPAVQGRCIPPWTC